MKLLIPLDGSRFAESVLEPVVRLVDLKRGEVEVHLLKVVDVAEGHPVYKARPPAPGRPPAGPYYTLGASFEDGHPDYSGSVVLETKARALDRMSAEARSYLTAIGDRYFPDIARVKVLMGHDPAEEIARYARRQKVDLIALATHGRTGLAEMLLGGVASRLLYTRAAPVFMVRPEALNGETAGDRRPEEAVA